MPTAYRPDPCWLEQGRLARPARYYRCLLLLTTATSLALAVLF